MHLVNIAFTKSAVSCVKIKWHLAHTENTHAHRKVAVECCHKSFAGYGMTYLHTYAEHIGVYARIGTAAAFDIGATAKYGCNSFLKNLLYGDGIVLHLPSVIGTSVIPDCYKKISDTGSI